MKQKAILLAAALSAFAFFYAEAQTGVCLNGCLCRT